MFLILRKEKSKCHDFSLQDLQEQFRRQAKTAAEKKRKRGKKKLLVQNYVISCLEN